MPTPDPVSTHAELGRLWLLGIAFAALAIIAVTYGIVSRANQSSHLREVTASQAVPTVAIVMPTSQANQTTLELPGRLEAYIRAPIYARVPGYLKSWQHDIGGKVKAGDLLGEIDTPDLDQQLIQARADLSVSQANAKLAQISAERWQSLAGTDAVAKEDVDTRTFTWNANVAQVKAAEANVERLVAEEGFKRLVAPFDGIVTARDTDIGALINVGSTGGPELFEVSETSRLRVYVSVPQNFVPDVPPGTRASITVPEHPGATFNATVEASAQSVNPSTGTTLMQLIVDNSAGQMMPGDYASIHLSITPMARVLSVPASALIFDSRGLSVATVDADNRVLLKHVSLARDLGAVVELSSGLLPTDQVIENPPDGITDGAAVRRAVSASVGAVASTQGKREHGKG
jgi:RND family efflux transporter MFP subunit